MLPDPPDSDREPVTDELIEEDMPCIRCHYNLRGLKPIGQCPECGTQIEKTVAFVNQRVLCPICFQPNHPTNALCLNCRNPLTGSAAAADYYRPKAMAARKRSESYDEEVEPEPPSIAWIILCWTFGVSVLCKLGFTAMSVWAESAPLAPTDTPTSLMVGRILETLLLLGVGLVPALVIYFPTMNYRRLRAKYLKKHAAFMAKEAALDAKEREERAGEELGAEEEG